MDGNNIYFNHNNHEFDLLDHAQPNLYSDMKLPLSLIVQVTRKCNLKCSFCSESEFFPDPSLESLEKLRNKIEGVHRIYLSGGEPLLRTDIFEIIEMYRPYFNVLGLPTNSINISKDVCTRLAGKVNYINAGLDGVRNINNIIRGDYDGIISGLFNLKDSGIQVSLSTVILKDTLQYLPYVIQIADLLNIVKVKMVIPVPRGRAKDLKEDAFASNTDITNKFNEIKQLKEALGWKPRIKFTFWDKSTEGYALIVYPNQKVYAWPVFDSFDCVLYIGDLDKESISDIWDKYPYKANHINKYVGLSMNKA